MFERLQIRPRKDDGNAIRLGIGAFTGRADLFAVQLGPTADERANVDRSRLCGAYFGPPVSRFSIFAGRGSRS
jgi:hypothetical protein